MTASHPHSPHPHLYRHQTTTTTQAHPQFEEKSSKNYLDCDNTRFDIAMPALTRSQARKLRAEGKDFQDPTLLGKKAPPDPPRISKRKRSKTGTQRLEAAGDTGTNVEEVGKKARRGRPGGRANVTAATEAIVEDAGHQSPPAEAAANVAPVSGEAAHRQGEHPNSPPAEDINRLPAAEEAIGDAEVPQDPLPDGPEANFQPPQNQFNLFDMDQDLYDAVLGSENRGTQGDGSTRGSAVPSMSEESDRSETPTANLISLSREEAEAGGGLEIPNVGLPTLANEIHALWDDGNWRFDPQLGYDVDDFFVNEARPDGDQQRDILETLTPARRLISLWLTRREYRGFWATILLGPATYDEEDRFWDLEPVEMTSERSRELEERLEDIAARHHFIFEPPPRNPGRLASTVVITADEPQTWRGNEFAPGYVTFLDPDFESAVWSDAPQGSFRRWTDNSRCERLRYLFFLAVTLGGSLAELLWMDRYRSELRDPTIRRRPQPRIMIRHQLPYSDLVYAFQEFILGGRLMAINQAAPMAPDGLALRVIREVDVDDGVVGPESGIDVGVVRMDGIVDRFSAVWWRNAGRTRTTATMPVSYAPGVDED
ncbi:MAG: hypothetical protein Q9186_000591 [Xanthomendoza sp. 1 TL-2023]